MSDHFIRMIPTDPEWQPTAEAASRMVKYVATLFAGSGDHAEAVEPIYYDRITLIDGGEYMEQLFCPRCEADIGLDWFWELIRERNDGRMLGKATIHDLYVTVPCCAAALMLSELRFEASVGFARFEVSVRNWTRGAWELSEEELAAAGAALGHPVTQVAAHY